MPTKSNNTGGRGGARPGAGRKKSAVKEKAENGNPGGRRLEVLDIPEVEGVDMPKPHEFLSAEQRDGSTLQAEEIYKETWEWLKKVGCAAKVSPQLLERYAMCSARWIQCEEMTNRMGFLSKHPTTQKPIPSPFINIGINYMNQAVRLWNEIFQIVKENCSTDYGEVSPQDTRYTGPLETAPTVNATYGMGGNNQPFVVETPKTLKIRSGCEGGGKGALIQDNKSATLGCNNDQTVFVPFVKGTRPHSSDEGQQWKDGTVANTLNTHDVGETRCNELAVKVYGICSKQSHAMQSDNPHSGFYEADTSRCLDRSGGNPSCNQGGMAVVAVQGSMIGRSDKNGPQGSGVNEDVSFTFYFDKNILIDAYEKCREVCGYEG